MAKIGDTVRYLNAVGGGVITRIEGKVAFVDENGFETPVMLKDIVVVLPAGHQSKPTGPRLMFDQAAFDQGRNPARASSRPVAREESAPVPSKEVVAAPQPERKEPVEITPHGDRLSLALVFEPENIKELSRTKFNALLVNDSNYTLLFSFSRRGDDDHMWTSVFSGRVAPNEMADLSRLALDELPGYGRVLLQGIAFREDSPYEMKHPFSFVRRLDLTKFHKLHCFRPGIYFDNPVLEISLMDKDRVLGEAPAANDLKKLSDRYAAATPDRPKESQHREKRKNPADNPHKLLPLIEIDLHIGELTDTTVGMEPKDMLNLQLDTVRSVMKTHEKRIGQKIVFIHGKGDGVLRQAVRELLKKQYPKSELQDASFREYGFGATLVTVR